MMDSIKPDGKQALNTKGCGVILLVGLVSIWIIILSGINLFSTWVLEQSMFESSVGVSDFRWIIQAVFAVLVLLPTLILNLVVKIPRLKLIFRLWMFAAILTVLTIPLKMLYLTAQNETAILQLSSMGLLLVGMYVFKKPQAKENQPILQKTSFLGIAGIMIFGIAIPWLLWGALGSVIDTLLEMLVGIVFGFLVIKVAYPNYLERVHTEEREIRVSDFILDGFVLFVFLLILVAALAHNGSQSMMVITVPISGWMLAGLSIIGIGRKGQSRIAVFFISAALMALPLVFFDMDELSLIIGSSEGETLFWANKAAWFTFMSLLTVFIVLVLNFRFIKNIKIPKKWDIGLLAVSIAGFVIVYVLWGQTGFHGDNIFLILKSQANLTSISTLKDYATRRQAVFAELTRFAEDEQESIHELLDQYHVDYTPYYLINGIEVSGGNLAKIILSKNESIEQILDSPQLRPLPIQPKAAESDSQSPPEMPTWNIQMIRSDKVKNELKITGKGIIIGQSDSGVYGRHDQLNSNYRGANSSDDYNWYDPWYSSSFPVDLSGHGTMTLGIAAGKDIGIAPDAQWIGCVNLARNLGNPAKYLDCMQFMLAPFPQGGNPFTDGTPSKGAMIVNNSWGCPTVEGCDADVFMRAMEAMTTAGVFMSSAAGNTGYYGCGTVTDPIAIYPTVFTTGSINQAGDISAFSSIGPVLVDGSDRQKPDLLAPGEQITSSFADGGYSTEDGTSFAAPHVTGVVALMWSANPSLIGDIQTTMQILRNTTQQYKGSQPVCGETNQAVGAGVLDAYAAVQAAMNWK